DAFPKPPGRLCLTERALHPVLAQRMGARPFRDLAVGTSLNPRLERAFPAEGGEHFGCSGGIVARLDHIFEAKRVGLIFLLARKAQEIEHRSSLEDARRSGAEDCADHLP